VRLLGAYTIQTVSGELRTGLRASARELLAYYLVQPDGASLEEAVEAMWPDTDPGRVRERFWTALGNLRSVLRAATGAGELKAITRDGVRYRVDQGLFAVDLWRFHGAWRPPAALTSTRRWQPRWPRPATPMAVRCWTAPPMPGWKFRARIFAGGRLMRWPAWPSCARPPVIGRGR
jgi:hypothetical protein